jgi:hypothetical protein
MSPLATLAISQHFLQPPEAHFNESKKGAAAAEKTAPSSPG